MRLTVTNSRNPTASVFTASMVCLVILLIVLVTLITLSPQVQAQSSNVSSSSGSNSSSSNVKFHNKDHSTLPTYPSVFSADSKPYNLTYGEWTARWWQWGYSIPKNVNPAYDNTGKDCGQKQKQNGPVWFLAGTYGHSVNRVCTIPTGKAILFPILNSECSFAEFPKLKTLSELHTCAKSIQDQVTTLNASIDGVPIPNLEKYRIQSPLFNFTLPQNNILRMPANTTTEAVGDGNWVFLKPLSPGIHKLMFKGGVQRTKIGDNSNGSGGSFAFPSGWDFETRYDITVSKAKNGYYYSSYSNHSSLIEQRNMTTTVSQHIW
jgi:hypothetical protein